MSTTEAINNTTHRGSETITTNTSKSISFYWELSREEQALAQTASAEEEGFLAQFINQGRRLVSTPFFGDYGSPELISLREMRHYGCAIDDLETYSDPVATILSAAREAGIPPEKVCEAALFTHEAVRDGAMDSARAREAAANSRSSMQGEGASRE
jgi:hypothetical protein